MAVAVSLFALTIKVMRPDVGGVFLATLLLGIAGTAACLALVGGSVLGIYALARQAACRTRGTVISVLVGMMGAIVLGWIALGFWTR